MMNKPNFKQMTLAELRKYVLAHRDDQEAWTELLERPRPLAHYFPSDMPMEEQLTKLSQLIENR